MAGTRRAVSLITNVDVASSGKILRSPSKKMTALAIFPPALGFWELFPGNTQEFSLINLRIRTFYN